MIDNIFILTDPTGTLKADKKAAERINDAVATIMDLKQDIR